MPSGQSLITAAIIAAAIAALWLVPLPDTVTRPTSRWMDQIGSVFDGMGSGGGFHIGGPGPVLPAGLLRPVAGAP